MPLSPLAGKPAPKELLVDLARLEREYYERVPDTADPTQLVSFGTSGHRGSALRGSFNEAHIVAITQADGLTGPLGTVALVVVFVAVMLFVVRPLLPRWIGRDASSPAQPRPALIVGALVLMLVSALTTDNLYFPAFLLFSNIYFAVSNSASVSTLISCCIAACSASLGMGSLFTMLTSSSFFARNCLRNK